MAHHIRWFLRRDILTLELIDASSYETPWSNADFLTTLRDRSVIGMVAESREHIDAFTVYRLHPKRVEILRFAVAPDSRRLGLGTLMLDKLKYKLFSHRRDELTITVPDSDLAAHLFLRANDFRATAVVGDLYEFTYRPAPDEVAAFEFNRSRYPWQVAD